MARRSPKPRFKRPRKSSRFATWWMVWRVPVLLLIVMTAWWFVFRPIASEMGWVAVKGDFSLCGSGGERTYGCVVDGDTVIIGFGPQRRRIRLTGFDAPEIEGACEAESQLAITARRRLSEWLSQGQFEWDGADDPPRDQYGRELRSVRRIAPDGTREYLAETMIGEGLAAESGWGAEENDWCS